MADILPFTRARKPEAPAPSCPFEEARDVIQALHDVAAAQQRATERAGLVDPYTAGQLQGYTNALAVLEFLCDGPEFDDV